MLYTAHRKHREHTQQTVKPFSYTFKRTLNYIRVYTGIVENILEHINICPPYISAQCRAVFKVTRQAEGIGGGTGHEVNASVTSVMASRRSRGKH